MSQTDDFSLSKTILTLLMLVRLSIGKESNPCFPDHVDWYQLIELAFKQGLTFWASDGLQIYYDTHPQIDASTQAVLDHLYAEELDIERMQFFLMLKPQEKMYLQHERAIASLAQFYGRHNIPMMLLKGHGLSLNYPKPSLRPTGDIDIYLFGKWREADYIIHAEKGIEVSNEHEHHTTFNWEGISVENHYDFVNTHTRRSNRKLETEFKQMAQDKGHTVEIDGQVIYLPSPNLNALFLLRHASMHFAAEGISLRHVLDWAFFVESQGIHVDWPWLVKRARYYNMHRFLSCIDQICVEHLGFSPSIFPILEVDTNLTDQVLSDIFQFDGMTLNETIPQKMKRWASRRWQYNICFSDSRLSYFLTSMWEHLKR